MNESADSPAERPFVHALPEAHWPTAADAVKARLFSPIAVNRLMLTSRTWVPAMVPWRATEDGFVTEENVRWYERFASGEPGAIVVEATGIRDVPSGPLLRIGHDRFIPGLAKIVDGVRRGSGGKTKLFIQIIDFLAIRRRPAPETFIARFLKIDAALRRRLVDATGDESLIDLDEARVREALSRLSEDALAAVLSARDLESLRMGFRERVTDLDQPHIKELPRVLPGLFAAAARRAREAGFDGVELHFAHAYTMASFLSARNVRDDGYGKTREGRMRLPLETIAAVRAAVGGDWALGCRFLGEEAIDGGSTLDDARAFGVAFARAGLDFLSISKGGKFEDAKQPMIGHAAYPYTGPSGHECMPTVRIDRRGPFGRNLSLARGVKEAVNAAGFRTPIVGAGGIATFDLAEEAIARGDVDIAGFARQALADPDFFKKVRSGHGASVRRCEFTNYCEGLDQRHKEVTCRLWDKIPAAPDEPKSADGKRRLLPPPWDPPTIE